MAVVPKQRKNKVIYYAVNRWRGRYVWERAGTGEDRREAERLDARIQKQIKAQTYEPKRTGAVKVSTFAGEWFSKRRVRTVDNESDLWKNHVLKRLQWFAEMRIDDVRPKHALKFAEDLGKPYVGKNQKERTLSGKSIAIICGFTKTMFGSAVFEEIINRNPFELPRGTLSRKPREKRLPYTIADVKALLSDPVVDPDRRVWIAMAFFTGMREGEICGRRWRDLDREAAPLQCLDVHSQYQDQPLKTDDKKQSRPRKVPVHPELSKLLDWWWREGWEFVYCRRPTLGDFIVPRRDDVTRCLSKSMAYKAWRGSCAQAKVESHTLHSTRHTFVSTCRRRGARAEVVEVITHNSDGRMIDQYTTWDWQPLCEAVMFCQYELGDWTAPISAASGPNSAGSGGPSPNGEAHGSASSCNQANSATGSSPGAGAIKEGAAEAPHNEPLVAGLMGHRPKPFPAELATVPFVEALEQVLAGRPELVLAPLRKAALAVDGVELDELAGAAKGGAW